MLFVRAVLTIIASSFAIASAWEEAAATPVLRGSEEDEDRQRQLTYVGTYNVNQIINDCDDPHKWMDFVGFRGPCRRPKWPFHEFDAEDKNDCMRKCAENARCGAIEWRKFEVAHNGNRDTCEFFDITNTPTATMDFVSSEYECWTLCVNNNVMLPSCCKVGYTSETPLTDDLP